MFSVLSKNGISVFLLSVSLLLCLCSINHFFVVNHLCLGVKLIAVAVCVPTTLMSNARHFSFLKYIGQGSEMSNTNNLSIT